MEIFKCLHSQTRLFLHMNCMLLVPLSSVCCLQSQPVRGVVIIVLGTHWSAVITTNSLNAADLEEVDEK